MKYIILAIILLNDPVYVVQVYEGAGLGACKQRAKAEEQIHQSRLVGTTYKNRVLQTWDISLQCIRTPEYPQIVVFKGIPVP